MNSNFSPPKLAEYLLKIFIISEDRDHRIGDFNEYYQELYLNKGKFKAKLWYWIQVLNSIPAIILNEFYWGGSMFKSYFKIAIRNLYKTKLYSILNIFGLGIAIALAIVGYINYEFSQSFDSFHQNKDRIYSINSYQLTDEDGRRNWSYIPFPMGIEVKNNIPGVEKMSRISVGSGIIRYEDKVFNEAFHFVDNDFLEIFSYKLLKGKNDALKDNSSIIITDEIAVKYFGKENPIGKELIVSPDGKTFLPFNVQAIVQKAPKNSSVNFNFLISSERVEELKGFKPLTWESWARATFILLDKNANPKDVNKDLQVYLDQANKVNPDFMMQGFYLIPLPDLAFETRNLSGTPFKNGIHPAAIIAPSVIVILVLLLACFNFVNTAISFSGRRLKEIGIRKVMGGFRSQLVSQFLIENILLCFSGLLLGAFLAIFFVPFYNDLWPELDLRINYSENIGLVVFLIGLLFLTGLTAGGYPAFYISKFNPINIFKGKQKLGGISPLIRVLLVLQFAISMTSLIAAFVLYQNGNFIQNLDLGFAQDQVLVLNTEGESQFNIMKNSLENHPAISSIGGSKHVVGRFWTTNDIQFGEVKRRVISYEIGENYLETAELNLIEGRTFDKNIASDTVNSVIINETFQKEMAWQKGVGQYFKIKTSESEKEYLVIGVVKDFYYNGVWKKIKPAMFSFGNPKNYRNLSINFDVNKIEEITKFTKEKWRENFPNIPYKSFFQSMFLEEAKNVIISMKKLFMYIAFMVIITTALGLFALVSLNIAKRSKEISIRKVLGASVSSISKLISKDFIILLLIASILASVMGYYMVSMMLSSIWAYYVDITVTPFILATIFMIFLAFLSVSSQLYSITKSNPIDNIREE